MPEIATGVDVHHMFAVEVQTDMSWNMMSLSRVAVEQSRSHTYNIICTSQRSFEMYIPAAIKLNQVGYCCACMLKP